MNQILAPIFATTTVLGSPPDGCPACERLRREIAELRRRIDDEAKRTRLRGSQPETPETRSTRP